MASYTTVYSAVSLIIDFVTANPGCSQDDVVAGVLPGMKVTGDYNVVFPLQSLLAANVVSGKTSGRKLQNLRINQSGGLPASSDGTVPKSAMEAAFKRFQEEKQAVIDRFTTQVNELQSSYEELKKEFAESKTAERIVRVELFRNEDDEPEVHEETFHKKFEDLLTLAKVRENIFMYGPTGSGKTFIAKQLARVLNLPFYFMSCTRGMSEGKLTGRRLPGSSKSGAWEYIPSEFVKAYEQGGVYLLDEIDAADDNVMLIVNTALANDQFAVPDRIGNEYVERHPDFVCIAAANTVGTGSDRQYSGRSKLDTAFLDRFGIGKLHIDYDPHIEAVLCPDGALREHYLRYRKAVMENRLERAVSTRFLQKAYKLFQEGWDVDKIDTALMLGWREDEINKVKSYR